MINIFTVNIFILLFFALYIEKLSNVGNILIRQDSTGTKKFKPFRLISFMFAPIIKNFLWYPKFWDINWFTFTIILNIIYYICLQILTHLSTIPRYCESENLDL